MDLKLAISVLALTTTVIGDPVSPSGPKYVSVLVRSDALNQLNEKEGQSTPAQPNESGPDEDTQKALYGPPAPVYEHHPDQYNPSNAPQTQYQNNQQPRMQPQYQEPLQSQQPQIQTYATQQPFQSQQPQIQSYAGQQPLITRQPQMQNYPVQQPLLTQQPQIQNYPVEQPVQNQQPNQMQQYQISQPASSQPLYQIAQQPGQQAVAVAQQTGSQPLYGNQQQILSQPLGQQAVINQQALNNQQLTAQPIQTYQQPNQFLIGQAANQQTMLTQQAQPILLSQQAPFPNQQTALLQQTNQNGPPLITSNQPINLVQPNNVGTSTYLVPVQQVPNNQVFAVNSG